MLIKNKTKLNILQKRKKHGKRLRCNFAVQEQLLWFFGSPTNDGLCSVCYKKIVLKSQQLTTIKNTNTETVSSAEEILATTEAAKKQNEFSSNESIPNENCTDINNDITEFENGSGVKRKCITENATAAYEQPAKKQSKTESPAIKKKNRCGVCRAKVGLTGFTCRCGGLFCGFHRYSDTHACTFDYREQGAQEIRRNNPVVIPEKIKKI